MCACHYRALQVETVCFDIPCCRQTESCFPLFPLRQYFPLWHVVFICWTKESLKLWAICLSRTARVMFLMPGSGNVFQCVIKSFDNYPLSISTEDMFIVLNDLLPVSLLFCILEIFSICLCFWHALQKRELTQSQWSPARCETSFQGNLTEPLIPLQSQYANLTTNSFLT